MYAFIGALSECTKKLAKNDELFVNVISSLKVQTSHGIVVKRVSNILEMC